jgi:cyanophycinase
MENPKGYLVSIGGAEDKGDKTTDKENSVDFLENGILKHIIQLTNQEQPIIEIITTATSYPLDTYRNYRDAFTSLGCVDIGHLNITDRLAANDEALLARLNKCHAVMFSGGDQEKLCAVLGGTLLLNTIKERYHSDHFIIAGTSAGAAAMSSTMIKGGLVEKAYFKGEVKLSLGFGFIHDVIIDTHFDARGRFARLAQAVAAQPGIIGIGISEDTGVIIERGGKLKAIGSSGITIIEGSEMQFNTSAEISEGTAISVGKLGVYIIAHLDEFDFNTKKFTRGGVQ